MKANKRQAKCWIPTQKKKNGIDSEQCNGISSLSCCFRMQGLRWISELDTGYVNWFWNFHTFVIDSCYILNFLCLPTQQEGKWTVSGKPSWRFTVTYFRCDCEPSSSPSLYDKLYYGFQEMLSTFKLSLSRCKVNIASEAISNCNKYCAPAIVVDRRSSKHTHSLSWYSLNSSRDWWFLLIRPYYYCLFLC